MALDEFQPSKVELLDTKVLADGRFRFERLTLQTETFAGNLSGVFERVVLRSGHAVVVLLFDPVLQKLILIEQFRVAAFLNHLPSAWILECVAGLVDEGEVGEEAARREVEEETGCVVGRVEQIGAYLSSPGLCDELVTIYVAEVDSGQAGGVHGEVSEHEDIRTVTFTVHEALAAADKGAIVNIMTQVALLWFARNGESLSRRWQKGT